MIFRCVLLLALLSYPEQGQASSVRGRQASLRRQGTRSAFTCNCDCCNTASRRPDERVSGASVKCAPAEGHSAETCTEQCAPDKDDVILGLVAQDQILDYSRFCFYECKPADGPSSLPATQCLALEADEVKKVIDKDGNPMDPGFLYAAGAEAAKKQKEEAEHAAEASLLLKASQEPDEVDPAEAKEAAMEGKEDAEDAVKSTMANMTRLRATKEATVIPDPATSGDPLLIATETRNIAAQAEEAAQKAADEAKKSVKALKDGRSEVWKDAMWQANRGVNLMRRTDYRLATATPIKSWRKSVTEAANAAAAPYMQAAAAYGSTAAQLNRQGAYDARNKAKALRSQADDLEQEAEILQRKGDDKKAELTFEHAKLKDEQAANYDGQAEKLLEDARLDVSQTEKNGYVEDANRVAYDAAKNLQLPTRVLWAPPPDPLRNWIPSAPNPFPTK